jgi:hypothetical protein
MMGIDDMIAELELDVLDLAGDLELVRERCIFGLLRNDVLLRYDRPVWAVLDSSL